MTELAAKPRPAEWLSEPARRRLAQRLELALRRARATGRSALASVSAPCGSASDPTAIVAASRRPGEPWFCFEQPDRNGSAVATLGCVRALEQAGAERFAVLARRWRELVSEASADSVEGPPGSGLAAFGGFAFAPDGGASPRWAGFAAASLIVPECTFARLGADTWITVTVEVAPDDTVPERSEVVERRLCELRDGRALPLLDPDPAGPYRVISPMPPAHYEEAVARAVQRISAGELQKVVLAREVEVHAPIAHDAAALIGVLRDAFPSCLVFAVGRGEATFVAASPELLVRREGQRASTVALAGSIGRSADPAVDDHLGERLLHSDKDREENAIVARRIARALRPHAVWVTAAPEPVLIKVANIQHLAAPIRAQLAAPISAIELAGLLHPTPAVGGEPGPVAERLIPALEGLDRGWYWARSGRRDGQA